jgi:hypothetical protein
MKHTAIVASAVLGVLVLAAPVRGQDVVKHSGSIVAIADDGRSFVLAEVGPWQVRSGETVLTRRTFTLVPETRFAMVGRVEHASSGFPGDFAEIGLGPDTVYLGDYVTVEARHEGKRLLALRITVIELPEREIRQAPLR